MFPNANGSFTARFLCAILLLATLSAPAASANICDLLTLNRRPEKTAARQNYANLSEAASRIETGGVLKSLFYGHRDRILLNAFFEGHLEKLNALVESKIHTVANPRVLEAYATLKQLNVRGLANGNLTLNQFNRIAFLYSQLLDLLLADDISSLLRNHEQSQAYEISKGRRTVSLLDSSDIELMSWIENGDLNPISTSSNGLSTIYPSSKGWTLLPTFASLSFRTILWGISRGIFFIGQTGKIEVVDGSAYSPSIFASHDYIHALISTSRLYNSASRRMWDKIEAALDSVSLSPKLLKIHEGILFFVFHEYTTFEMHCGALKPRFGDLREALTFDLNRGDLKERFNDKADFGQAFQEPVTKAEIKSAIDNVLNSIFQICR